MHQLTAFLAPHSDIFLIGSVLVISACAAGAAHLCTALLPGDSFARANRPSFSSIFDIEEEHDEAEGELERSHQ